MAFTDTLTGKIMQGSSAVYTVRPKVVKKIMVVFTSIHDTSLSSVVSKWLTSVIDTSKYVVCSVPESTIKSTGLFQKYYDVYFDFTFNDARIVALQCCCWLRGGDPCVCVCVLLAKVR